MNTGETKQDWVSKWKALSTKKKVIYVVIAFVSTQLLAYALTPNVDPCDCADVASKAEIIGYDNLTSKQQDLYKDCESKYTYSGEAFDACVNKHR